MADYLNSKHCQRHNGPSGVACIGSKFGHQFQIWPPGGATCISCKFVHQVAPLALVPCLVTRWRYLHWFQNCPPGSTTCITYQFGHQVAPLALPDCLWLPYWHHQLVLSWYLYELESHQLSLQKLFQSVTPKSTDRTPGIPGFDKNHRCYCR